MNIKLPTGAYTYVPAPVLCSPIVEHCDLYLKYPLLKSYVLLSSNIPTGAYSFLNLLLGKIPYMLDICPSMLKGKNILITGGAGFIGSNLAEHLSKSNSVTVLDDLSMGKKENLDGLNVKFIKGPILDEDVLKSLDGFDVIFHLAAIPGVQESIESPIETSEINFIGTVKMLGLARKIDADTFIFASSCAIYGDTSNLPISENEVPNPLSPYATQKLASEYVIRNYRDIYGIKGISARFFNVYGPRQDPNSEYSAVIPKFIDMCVKGKAPVIYGSGEQTRDFIYVKDLVHALELIAERSPEIDAINIGSGRETSINELAEVIIRETSCNLEPEHAPERKGEVERSLADISIAKRVLGWEPMYSLEDGIKETIEWMKR